jgi:hypothetical protein
MLQTEDESMSVRRSFPGQRVASASLLFASRNVFARGENLGEHSNEFSESLPRSSTTDSLALIAVLSFALYIVVLSVIALFRWRKQLLFRSENQLRRLDNKVLCSAIVRGIGAASGVWVVSCCLVVLYFAVMPSGMAVADSLMSASTQVAGSANTIGFAMAAFLKVAIMFLMIVAFIPLLIPIIYIRRILRSVQLRAYPNNPAQRYVMTAQAR